MTVESIEERVKRVVKKQLDPEKDPIELSDSFKDELKADSLDAVELIMAFEEEFSGEMRGMEIPESDAENLITVQAVVDYIKERAENRPSVKDLAKKFEQKPEPSTPPPVEKAEDRPSVKDLAKKFEEKSKPKTDAEETSGFSSAKKFTKEFEEFTENFEKKSKS